MMFEESMKDSHAGKSRNPVTDGSAESTRVHPRFRSILAMIAVLILATVASSSVEAEEPGWSKVGFRGAYGYTRADDFHQYEAFAAHSMRLTFNLSDDWVARGFWEMSAGKLSHELTDAVVFTAGPVFKVQKQHEPWFLQIGSRPTLISEYTFGDVGYGGPFQFTSHAGIGWSFSNVEVAYRIQHMSNASIYSRNDGLDIHVVELGWRF